MVPDSYRPHTKEQTSFLRKNRSRLSFVILPSRTPERIGCSLGKAKRSEFGTNRTTRGYMPFLCRRLARCTCNNWAKHEVIEQVALSGSYDRRTARASIVGQGTVRHGDVAVNLVTVRNNSTEVLQKGAKEATRRALYFKRSKARRQASTLGAAQSRLLRQISILSGVGRLTPNAEVNSL
jgi:hypothetical protein